jgi:hypothetical protein
MLTEAFNNGPRDAAQAVQAQLQHRRYKLGFSSSEHACSRLAPNISSCFQSLIFQTPFSILSFPLPTSSLLPSCPVVSPCKTLHSSSPTHCTIYV